MLFFLIQASHKCDKSRHPEADGRVCFGAVQRGGETMKRLIEWLDSLVYDHQGVMLILDIMFIAVAVVCTLINARVLLH